MTSRAAAPVRPAMVVRAAYAVALAGALAWAVLLVLAAASAGTLGFDYRAYDLAVDQLLAGRSMYDPDAQSTGGFGLFFYPPPFALLVLPIALLPIDAAVWAFTLLLAVAAVTGIAILPVSTRVRWAILLLAALSWPLVYAIRLGQVGPLLLLLFAIGWRWMDRPVALGGSAALGTLIKLQPALLLGWAFVTGRVRAAVFGVVVVLAAAAVATVVAGPQAWLDEVSLLSRVSRPMETPNGFGIGRLAFEAGLEVGLATLLHWANIALVVATVALATFRGSAVASYLAVVIATQFVSPVLWDHYALVLLLPVAWLLQRGRWWAAVIPLLTPTVVIGMNLDVPWLYPLAFWVALLGVTWEGLRQGRSAITVQPA